MVSFTKRFCAFGSPLAWFLKTTSSSQRRLTWKAGPWLMRGLPLATSSRSCASLLASSSFAFLAASSARSFLMRSSSASSSASSSYASRPSYMQSALPWSSEVRQLQLHFHLRKYAQSAPLRQNRRLTTGRRLRRHLHLSPWVRDFCWPSLVPPQGA